jgi:hypothetical protein
MLIECLDLEIMATDLQGLLSGSHDFFLGPWPLSQDLDVLLT